VPRGTSGPRLRIDAQRASRESDGWRLTWRVANEGAREVRVESTVLPHSGFRGAARPCDLAIAAGGATLLALPVAFAGPVENGFLILTVREDAARWRVFARVRVDAGADGEPRPVTARITTQRIGGSTAG
jgi:hypothetical protein